MKNQRILIIIVSLILVAGLLNCGKDNPADGGDPPTPPPQEDPMKVGSDGGSVSNEEGSVTLAIPSGSLSSEVTFTIGETTSHPGDAVGTVYDIGPDGTGFDPPATLTLSYDEADLPAGAQESELVLATVENNTWLRLTTTVEEQNNRVSAEIEHLSVYGIIWDSQGFNTIGPEGGTITSEDQKVILEIPEGALSTEVTFSIEETGDHPEGNRGTAYEIGPSGTIFDESLATLMVYYDENLLGDNESEEYLKLATVENNVWTEINTTLDVQNNTASALIGHLSVFGLVWDNPNAIGAEGGVIKSEDGLLTLSVPQGALTDEVLFSVNGSNEVLADILGKAYTIDPAGTEFQQPAGLSIAYNQQSLPSGTVEEQLVIVREVDGIWVELPTEVNIFNNTLTTEVTTTGTYSIREIFDEPKLTLFAGYYPYIIEPNAYPYVWARVMTGIDRYVEPPYQEINISDTTAVAPPLFDNPTAPCQPVERTLELTSFASNDVNTLEASGTFTIDKTSGDMVGFRYAGLTKADDIEYHAESEYNYMIQSLADIKIPLISNSKIYIVVKVDNPSNKRIRMAFHWENEVTHAKEGSTGAWWRYSTRVYRSGLGFRDDCTISYSSTPLDITIESQAHTTNGETGLNGNDEMILQADVKTAYYILFPKIESRAVGEWSRWNGVIDKARSYMEWSGSLYLTVETL